MNELKFQSELVKAALAEGGYAHKLSNRFLAGIPDLLVKLPDYSACLIECKHIRRKHRSDYVTFTPKVTALQNINMLDFQKAGGASGLAVLIEDVWPQLIFAEPYSAIYSRGAIKCPTTSLLTRNRGEPWPIKAIVRAVVSMHASIRETA